VYQADAPTILAGRLEQAAPGQLNELLSEESPLADRGSFDLVGELERSSGRLQEPAAMQDIGNDQYSFLFLEDEEMQRVVKSEITQLNNSVAVNDTGELSVGDSLSIAQELLVPGSHGAANVAMEFAEPVVDMAKGALGLGEGAQIRSIAQDLTNQGVTPETFDPRSEQLRNLIATRAPNLVPPEALEMDASMASADDDRLESSSLADGALAEEFSEAMNQRPPTEVLAHENVGSRYVGPLEGVSDDFVTQRVDGDIVSHRADLFENLEELELSLGKPMEIAYEHDGPSVKMADLAQELGIER
jgi:hypothetical protein